MNKINWELMDTFQRLHRVNIGALFPSLSQGELMVLHAIQNCGNERPGAETGIKVSDLVDELCVLPSALSRFLKTLEHEGYIVRYTGETDKRNIYVKITDSGYAVLKESDEILDDLANAVYVHVSEEEVSRVCSFLRRLCEITSDEIEKRKRGRDDDV